jgi:hypothetical protein
MRSGVRICRLLARARRTPVIVSFGSHGSPVTPWPTARASDGVNGLRSVEGAAREFERKGTGADLPTVAALVHWPTCEASDGTGGRVSAEVGGKRPSGAKRAVTLGTVASLVPWATPAARDAKGANTLPRAVRSPGKPEDQLANQAAHLIPCDSGTVPESSTVVETRPGASLNPYFGGWMMGYPAAWTDCRPLPATRSPAE